MGFKPDAVEEETSLKFVPDSPSDIKEPFPFLNAIKGGEEINKKIVESASQFKESNPSAYNALNLDRRDYNELSNPLALNPLSGPIGSNPLEMVRGAQETVVGAFEGATGGIPRAIIERVTGREIMKGNIAGRILGSMLPLGYVSKTLSTTKLPKLVKNAVEGAVAANLIEGLPSDEVFDIKNRIKSETTLSGAAFGAAVPLAVKGGIKLAKVIAGIPETAKREGMQVVGRLLNATHVSDFAYGKNPPKAVVEALGKDLPSGSYLELQSKVQAAIPRYVEKARTLVEQGQGNARLNLSKVLNSEIDDAINEAVKGGKNNQGLVTRLYNLKDSINFKQVMNPKTGKISKPAGAPKRVLDGVTPIEAYDLKQEIGTLSKWTGNASDDKLYNSTTKKLYGIVNSKVTNVVPASRTANETVSGLMSADNLLNRKVSYEQGAPEFRGAGKVIGTYGIMYGLATGNLSTVIASAEVLGISKLTQSVQAQTKLAYGLSKMGNEAQASFFTRFPKLKPIIDPILAKFSTPVSDAVKTAIAQAKNYSGPFS